LRAAFQFLTILPVPAPHVAPGASAIWFPLVGVFIGLAAALAWQSPMQAPAAILVAIVLTGGLHEDGLADVCDAVRAGRSREKMLAILKDSNIGAYGAIAIVLSILIRWHAMTKLSAPAWWQFAFVFAASRASMVVLAAYTPAIRSGGLGEAFRASLPAYAAPGVIVQAAILAYLSNGWWALLAVTVSVVAIRLWLLRRLGGFNGDCLGFQCQIAEAAALVVFAWR
jgi:adenosylcobinamide-GDP ribazoletransferase